MSEKSKKSYTKAAKSAKQAQPKPQPQPEKKVFVSEVKHKVK